MPDPVQSALLAVEKAAREATDWPMRIAALGALEQQRRRFEDAVRRNDARGRGRSMKRLVALCAVVLLSSCGGDPPQPPPRFQAVYDTDAPTPATIVAYTKCEEHGWDPDSCERELEAQRAKHYRGALDTLTGRLVKP